MLTVAVVVLTAAIALALVLVYNSPGRRGFRAACAAADQDAAQARRAITEAAERTKQYMAVAAEIDKLLKGPGGDRPA